MKNVENLCAENYSHLMVAKAPAIHYYRSSSGILNELKSYRYSQIDMHSAVAVVSDRIIKPIISA